MKIGTEDSRLKEKNQRDRRVLSNFFSGSRALSDRALNEESAERLYESVSIAPRLGAGLLDFIIMIFMPATVFASFKEGAILQNTAEILYSPLCALLILFYIMFKTMMEGTGQSASLGMAICGLRVGPTHADGFDERDIGLWPALVRNITIGIILLILTPVLAKLYIEREYLLLLGSFFCFCFLTFQKIEHLPQDYLTDTTVFRFTDFSLGRPKNPHH